MSLEPLIQRAARSAGLDVVGFSAPRKFSETEREIRRRKAAGLLGRMRFTFERPEVSCDPRSTLPEVRTVVTCGLAYPAELPPKPFRRAARIAAYARKDYYSELRSALEHVAGVLRAKGHEAVVVADSNAFTDRPPAVEAGIGRYGKNSMVITYTHGSWVLLGSVLTSAELSNGSPSTPDCGACTLCAARCPTGAITAEGVIDARRCIAYLLQAPGDIPEAAREAVGDRLYGCDDCQSCCPLNRNAVTDRRSTMAEELRGQAWVDPVVVLEAPDSWLRQRFGHFYIPRRDFDYLRRNALVVLGNCGERDDLEVVERYRRSSRRMLRSHAEWAAERIRSRDLSATRQDPEIGRTKRGVSSHVRSE